MGISLPCATSTPEPGCGWVWINEQPIDAENTDSPYTNWQNGEPNNLAHAPDAYHRATEDFLAIGLNGGFGWNDEGALTNVWGYVVEYGDEVPATTCTAEQGGCNPTGAQLLQLPATAQVAPDATLSHAHVRLPRRSGPLRQPAADAIQRCGRHPAVSVRPSRLHRDRNDHLGRRRAATARSMWRISPKMCCRATCSDAPRCARTRTERHDPDPSHRDVVAWQAKDPQDMLETSLGTGRFFGTLAEVTYGCGSSRGKVVNGSYHFVGLRIHPGPGQRIRRR